MRQVVSSSVKELSDRTLQTSQRASSLSDELRTVRSDLRALQAAFNAHDASIRSQGPDHDALRAEVERMRNEHSLQNAEVRVLRAALEDVARVADKTVADIARENRVAWAMTEGLLLISIVLRI